MFRRIASFKRVNFNEIIIKLTESIVFTSTPLETATFIPDKSFFLVHSIRLSSYDNNKNFKYIR